MKGCLKNYTNLWLQNSNKCVCEVLQNIWATDLPEVRSLSFFNCVVRYPLGVIDDFTKYAWVKPFSKKINKKLKQF